MSELNTDKLLEPVTADNPVGDDLSYDPQFYELEQLGAGKPEQQVGDTIIAAEEPDWKGVRKLATELLGRSKDIRIALHLAGAAVRLYGIPGMGDGLALMRGMLEKYWPDLHPKLDPEDNNDPLMRMNILSALVNTTGYLKLVREAPLADSKLVGRFSLRDIEIATGEVAPAETRDPNVPLPDSKLIDGAFEEMPLEQLQASLDAANRSVEHVKAIDAFLTTTVGAAKALNFDDAIKVVGACQRHLANAMTRRQGGDAPVTGDAAAGGGMPALSGGGSGGVSGVPGEIRSKSDIIRVIDKICDYYDKYEPSSPVPLLLRRVQRLVNKNFIDIIKDLTPASLSTIESLAGIEPVQE